MEGESPTLTIYKSLKNSYLKKNVGIINKRFRLTSIRVLPYMKKTAMEFKLVYGFINFIIPLPVTFVKHSWGNSQRLVRRLLKQMLRIVRLLWKKVCRGTAKLNEGFKLLPRQLNYRRIYSWNSNATSVANSYMK